VSHCHSLLLFGSTCPLSLVSWKAGDGDVLSWGVGGCCGLFVLVLVSAGIVLSEPCMLLCQLGVWVVFSRVGCWYFDLVVGVLLVLVVFGCFLLGGGLVCWGGGSALREWVMMGWGCGILLQGRY